MKDTLKTSLMLPVEHSAGEDIAMRFADMLVVAGRAGKRQRDQTPLFGLTQNLGGFRHQNVRSVVIVGGEGA